MLRYSIVFLFIALSLGEVAKSQSQTPIIVQPANSAAAGTSTSLKPAVAADAQSIPAAIKLLEEIKAGNAEFLAKQKAALEKLDELKEAADQLQIFAKRG
jgi:hypothetical protein